MTFDRAVSGLTALDISGTTQMDGGSITSTGIQTYRGAVTQSVDTTLTGLSVTFNGTVSGAGNELTINAPATTFGDADEDTVTGISTLTTDAAGTTTINTDSISGAVLTFNDAVVLGTSTTLTGTTSVAFNGTVVGASNDLTINSPTTTFGDADTDTVTGVGTLTTDAAGTITINTDTISSTVLTFNDAVILGTSTTLIGITSATFNQTVDGPHDLL